MSTVAQAANRDTSKARFPSEYVNERFFSHTQLRLMIPSAIFRVRMLDVLIAALQLSLLSTFSTFKVS